jgi:polar amino acid transport system substrate-binding protein
MRLAALLLLSSLTAAQASDFKVCVDANDWPPYTYATREGTLQILVRMAMAEQGGKVYFTALPWRRCEMEVEKGTIDAALGMPPTAASLARFAFPRSGGRPDTARSVAVTDIVLLRRAGSPVAWDGQHLSGFVGSVLYPQGYEEIQSRLAELGIPCTDDYHSDEQNLRALLAGRSTVMATYIEQARRLAVDPQYGGRIEILAPPLLRYDYYLAFGLGAYGAATTVVERLWGDLAKIRERPDYQEAVKDLLR